MGVSVNSFEYNDADVHPTAKDLLSVIGRYLQPFGCAIGGYGLVLISANANNVIGDLRLAMFMREGADSGDIKACRPVDSHGLAAATARLAEPLACHDQGAELKRAAAAVDYLVAARAPFTLARAAEADGLVVKLIQHIPHRRKPVGGRVAAEARDRAARLSRHDSPMVHAVS